MKRVVATGTFDILHPGHLYYLEQSKKLGDELTVIVARDVNVKHKPRPIIPEEQRRKMVAALRCVDRAILGDEHDMFRPIDEIRPAIITIGFNQHFNEERLRSALGARGFKADIVRIGKYGDDELCSSRLVVRRIVEQRAGDQDSGGQA